MKKIIAAALSLMMLLSVAGAFAEAAPVTVSIWSTFTDAQDAYLRQAAADFNAWVPAFEKAVPYYRMSARWYSVYTSFHEPMTEVFDGISSDHRVLSMFFPGKQYNNVYPSWNKTIQQLQWNGPISWQQYGW
jgi:spermidine/putrescine-binding protein